MGSFDLTLFKGTTKSRHELLDGQGYLDVEKGSLVLKIDGVISEFRPGRVGADKNKPAKLREGESYLATDTYKLYFGGRLGEIFELSIFPAWMLVENPDGNKCFRLFVDGANGDDNNDGLSWAKAKKTIQAAYDSLPYDLKGHDAWVIVAPGTYNKSLNCKTSNGWVINIWGGADALNINHPWAQWWKHDGNPTSNDPVVVDGGDDKAIGNYGKTKITFKAYDPSKAPWQAGWGFGTRWRFTTQTGWAVVQTWSPDATIEFVGARFDLGGARAGFDTGGTNINLFSCEFHGGSGEASTSTSKWRGAILFNGFGYDVAVNLGKVGGAWKFRDDYPVKVPEGLYFADIKQAITFASGIHAGIYDNCSAVLYEDINQSYGKTQYQFHADDDLVTMKYDDRYINIVDNSKGYLSLYNLNTGVKTVRYNEKLRIEGDGLKLKDLPTSDPQEAGVLWNDSGTVKISSG